ncbi:MULTISPECIES: lysophospholipid acyltransferase family protein [Clostridium]|uniref:lysophospholipid acyltransferase family protein n=1 Tax=Clostridium TaxID=1485 RepID=UPI00082400FD|nr:MULTISPECIES: lysophospholipid acyltransferase family protein [Clostridium]PJI07673.1 1-acyl-sn-glycerol-3-phosphate acyltransferase [Clostridium sp. CT7]
MISPVVAKIIELLPDTVTGFLSRNILKMYLKKYADIQVRGMENLKGINTPIMFIGNHLSNSDGLVLNKVLEDYDVTFVAGVKLNKDAITKLGTYCVKTTPIKPNTADKEGISRIIKLLRNKNNIFVFPEGTRSRTGGMIEAKKGPLLIAKMGKAVIVPVGICGSEKLMPIDKSGNMYDESFHYAKVKVNIGKPFYFGSRNKDENKKDYEKRVIDDAMYKIAELIPEEYRGVYSYTKKVV